MLSGPNYLELSGLQGNRRYDFWVKAETSKGYGPASDITSIILARTGKGSFINDVTQIQTYYDPHHYSDMQLLPPPCPLFVWRLKQFFNRRAF